MFVIAAKNWAEGIIKVFYCSPVLLDFFTLFQCPLLGPASLKLQNISQTFKTETKSEVVVKKFRS